MVDRSRELGLRGDLSRLKHHQGFDKSANTGRLSGLAQKSIRRHLSETYCFPVTNIRLYSSDNEWII